MSLPLGVETLLNGLSHIVKSASEISGYLADEDDDTESLSLPPLLHYGSLFKGLRRWGMWRRHRIEAQASEDLGPIFGIVPPPGGPNKFFVFVSDPTLVQVSLIKRNETFSSLFSLLFGF
jgi:hypothetical protein